MKKILVTIVLFIAVIVSIILSGYKGNKNTPPTGSSPSSRLQFHVEEFVKIEAPAEVIWKLVGNFEDLSWVKSVSVTESSATQRIAQGPGGILVKERLLKNDQVNKNYSYSVDLLELEKNGSFQLFTFYEGELSLKKESETSEVSILSWKSKFELNQDTLEKMKISRPEWIRELVQELFRKGLHDAKTTLESK